MYNNPMQGKFIVIEGTDGSGKGEQTIRLLKHLKDAGLAVAPFDFPRYSEPSSWFVSRYLNGEFGTIEEVGPKTASLSTRSIVTRPRRKCVRRFCAETLSSRTATLVPTLATRVRNFPTLPNAEKYFEWNYDLEFNINKIPKPDLNIILHVPAAIAQQLVDKKVERQYLSGKKRDLHETDLGHLERTEAVYKQLAELFPKDFTMIECVENGALLSMDQVHEKVWTTAQKILG